MTRAGICTGELCKAFREKYMLLCEGYMDVIAMHQAGFTNAVASLGTAFTAQHAALLKRYKDQVILTYDSDGAGVKGGASGDSDSESGGHVGEGAEYEALQGSR